MVEWFALVRFEGIAFTILVSSGALVAGIVAWLSPPSEHVKPDRGINPSPG